jgi:hypothetical protein
MPEPDGSWARLQWFVPVDLNMADPIALDLGKFHDRHPQGYRSLRKEDDLTPILTFAAEFAHLTYGLHLVAAMPHFDLPRLQDILLDAGLINGWNHAVCIESLMLGYLAAIEDNGTVKPGAITFPWKSADLYKALGLDLSKYLVHTAMGDCDLAKAAWDVIFPSVAKVRDPVELVYTPQSSAIQCMSYNKDTLDLRVTFKSATRPEWIYQAVPQWVWMEGKKAESTGGWFANMIKGKYLSYRSDDPMGAPVTKDGVTQWEPTKELCNEFYGKGPLMSTQEAASFCIRTKGHPGIAIDNIGHSDLPHLCGR